MLFFRYAIAFAAAVGLFVFIAVLPHALRIPPQRLMIAAASDMEKTSALKSDSADFHQQVKDALPVATVKKKRGKQPETWVLGKGIALPVYLLRAQRKIQSLNGSVIRMQELNKANPSARLIYTTHQGDTAEVELSIGNTYLENSSQVGLAFTVDSTLDLATLNTLSALPCSYSLLVQPFDTNKALRYDLDKLQNKELVCWIAMEPHGYPWIKAGPNAILLHHSAKEIAEIIAEAMKRLPDAAGFATRLGQRAVEHRPLLQALLSAIGRQRSWLLDLSGNPFSKVPELCAQMDMNCAKAEIAASRQKRDQAIESAINTATRTGYGLIVLPASAENAAAILHALPQIRERGAEIVKLSEIISQTAD